MSASAPLGRPSKKTGKVDAVCTRATQMGEDVNDVIIQAAATSLIHMETLAINQVHHSMRNTAIFNGASADREAGSGFVSGFVLG